MKSMINAIIYHRENTLVLELPRSVYVIHEKLMSIGYDAGLKDKLASMVWGVAVYRGELFGKIECSLKEEMTPAEEEILKDYITGQNSDGWGEHFEQQPIDTEDGDLYVSFWNSGDDYSIMTHDELDEYIANEGMQMGGM